MAQQAAARASHSDRLPTLSHVYILHLRTTAAHNLCLHMALLLPAAAVPHQRVTYVDDFAESHKEPLDINNLLLRGSVLRKTPWVIGVAINVGNDSKIVQNMTKAPRKVSSRCCFGGNVLRFGVHVCRNPQLPGSSGPGRVSDSLHVSWVLALQVTQLERAMNVLVFVQFSALLVFSAVLAGLDQWWTIRNSTGNWYLPPINRWPELAPGGLGWFVSVRLADRHSSWALHSARLLAAGARMCWGVA